MKKIVILLIMLIYLCFLSGCASFIQAQQTSNELKQDCLTRPVLMTDLTKSHQDQTFQLPDGRTCPKKFV